MAGSVYLVDIDNKKTAIKIINKNKSYRQEKFILQKINRCTDSNLIIRLFDFIDNKNMLFVEYNDMVSIESIISKISNDKKLNIAKKLYEALQIIHNCNISHGDFKAKNTLISKDYNDIKIIDFGLSKIHTDEDKETRDKRILQDYTKFKYFLLQLFFNAEYDEYIYEEYNDRIKEMNEEMNEENKEFVDFFNEINKETDYKSN